jgi:uncharacterized protein (DUF1778 family)
MAIAAAQKEARIDLRTTCERKDFIARAARASGQNISEFVLSSACERAEIALADQTDFTLPEDRWKAFVAALDRPATRRERLAKLMSEPSVLER